MELGSNEGDNQNPVTSFNFVLQDSLGTLKYTLFYIFVIYEYLLQLGMSYSMETHWPLWFSQLTLTSASFAKVVVVCRLFLLIHHR